MLTTLPFTAREVSADRLTFSLDVDSLPAEGSVSLSAGGMEVSLRLVGSGHQVIVGSLVETVAAVPSLPGPLPYGLEREVGGWTHRFTADVYRREPADFDHAVAFLHRYLADRDDALVAVPPRSSAEGVLSGLLLRPLRRGLGWRGWHTFPTSRQIVVTRSRMLIH